MMKMSATMQETRVVNVYHGTGYDVSIMRPSRWGNPYSHLPQTSALWRVDTREDAVRLYDEWVRRQPHLMKALHELKGKVLGCCCKPKQCHGDVLVKLVNEAFPEQR